jgi:hypothetical protein
MHRVVAAKALQPFRLWLRFADDHEGVVDLADVFDSGGVFERLRDPDEFAKVRVEHEFGTVEWPGGVDLDPDGLYARLRGMPIEAVLKQP